MKSILRKSLSFGPYLLLILIYFIFINIEAKNEKVKNNSFNNDSLIKYIPKETNSSTKRAIPVIPYNK